MYRLHTSLVSAAKVMHCIQWSLVQDLVINGDLAVIRTSAIRTPAFTRGKDLLFGTRHLLELLWLTGWPVSLRCRSAGSDPKPPLLVGWSGAPV